MRGEEGNNCQLCRTWHKGRQSDGGVAFVYVFNGACGHYCRHGASASQNHGNETSASQTYFVKQSVGDESNSRHVTACFQHGNKPEQQHYLRNETDNAHDAGYYAVHNKRTQPFDILSIGKPAVNGVLQPRCKSVVNQVCQESAQTAYGNVKHQRHYHGKNGESQPFVQDDFVYFLRDALRTLFLYSCGVDALRPVYQFRHNAVSFLGDSCRNYVAEFFLRFFVYLLNLCLLLLRKVAHFNYCLVLFQQFQRYPATVFSVCDKVFQLCNAILDGVAVNKVLFGSGGLRRAVVHQLFHALIFGSGNVEKLATELFFQHGRVNLYSLAFGLVLHVERNYYRHVQFHQLTCEKQVSFQVGGIHYIYYKVGFTFHKILVRHLFINGEWRKRVDAGRVHNGNGGVGFVCADFSFHRNAGPVAYLLVASRKYVEKRCLATVRVAAQRHRKFRFHRRFGCFLFGGTTLLAHLISPPLRQSVPLRLPVCTGRIHAPKILSGRPKGLFSVPLRRYRAQVPFPPDVFLCPAAGGRKVSCTICPPPLCSLKVFCQNFYFFAINCLTYLFPRSIICRISAHESVF